MSPVRRIGLMCERFFAVYNNFYDGVHSIGVAGSNSCRHSSVHQGRIEPLVSHLVTSYLAPLTSFASSSPFHPIWSVELMLPGMLGNFEAIIPSWRHSKGICDNEAPTSKLCNRPCPTTGSAKLYSLTQYGLEGGVEMVITLFSCLPLLYYESMIELRVGWSQESGVGSCGVAGG